MHGNTGSAAGFKAGIKYAHRIICTDFVWLLDDDNLPERSSISSLLQEYENLGSDANNAFLSMRSDRNQLKKAILEQKSIKLRPNTFLGFSLSKKLSTKNNINNSENNVCIEDVSNYSCVNVDYAPYGGFFFHKSWIPRIGFPNEEYFIYSDDHEYTNRVVRMGGKIWLTPRSLVEDLECSYRYRAGVKNVYSDLDYPSDRAFFEIRNKINFEKLSGLVGIFGKNYSGKSSIIDSVLYSIFNTTSKGERKNVHIINQNKDYAKCKISLQAGHDEFNIIRNLNKYTKKSRGGETIEAKVDLDFSKTTGGVTESLNGTTRNESDANIRKRFGNIDDFFLTSMSTQMDSMAFLREGSTKRKEIVAKFLDLQIFDQKHKLAKKEATEIRAVIKRMESKKFNQRIQKKSDLLEDIRRDIDEQIDKCKVYNDSIERFDGELAEINDLISSIPAEIININDVLSEIKVKDQVKAQILRDNLEILAKIQKDQEFITNYAKFLEGYDFDRLTDLKQKHTQILVEKRQVSDQEKQTKAKIQRQEKKLKLLDGIPCGDKYKTCKFICDANKAKDSLPATREELKNLKADLLQIQLKANFLNLDDIDKKIEEYTQATKSKEKSARSLEKNRMMLERNRTKIELLKNQLNSLSEKKKQYDENREAIENKETLFKEQSALTKKKSKVQSDLNKCNSLTQEYLIEEATAKQVIKSLHEEKNEFKEMQEEWIAYDTFINCMHPNGISYEIIQQKLPVINGEIAKILANIVDFEVFFENDAKKLELYIKHPNYGKRPLSMGSGAEKTIASMAIRLAMIAITNLPKSELFILDEPATALDQEHMEGFVRLLGMIKNQFKTVLIISHLDHLKDVVDMTIDIDKIDGYAKVDI